MLDQSREKAILIGVYPHPDDNDCIKSMEELERLLDTAGGEFVGIMTQARSSPDPRTYIGTGKLDELKEMCKNNDIDLVIFDCELLPSQIRNIEDEIDIDGLRVIDRSMLILDIFALHATSGEGRLQVDLAQLKYTAPRLTGKGIQMSRLAGGIGTRGPGESKLESDRRHLKEKVAALEDEIDQLDRARTTMRKSRERSGVLKASIVGYTNAGKSTLLNQLTDAGILAEDKLFATLDPTTRKFKMRNGIEILLTDTVGFIRNLPTHLIKAFKSTLDEAVYSDILIIVSDASDDECSVHLSITESILSDLGASNKPTLYVFNKCDISTIDNQALPPRHSKDCECVYISAKTGDGIDSFNEKLEILIRAGKSATTFVIPNDKQSIIDSLYGTSEVRDVDYREDGVYINAIVDSKTKGMLLKYIKHDEETN